MDDKLKAKLDAVFTQQKRRTDDAAIAEDARIRREGAALELFYNLRRELIRPAMEEVGNYIVGKGHSFRIVEQDESFQPHTGMKSRPAIKMEFGFGGKVGSGSLHHEQPPHLLVELQKEKGNMYFHQNTISPGRGGVAGSIGECPLDKLTTELIQEKIGSTVASIYGDR